MDVCWIKPINAYRIHCPREERVTIWCSQRCTKWAFYPLFQSLAGRGPDLTCYRQSEYFTNTDLTDGQDTMNPNCATTMVVLQCDCTNVLFVITTLPSEKDQRLHPNLFLGFLPGKVSHPYTALGFEITTMKRWVVLPPYSSPVLLRAPPPHALLKQSCVWPSLLPSLRISLCLAFP